MKKIILIFTIIGLVGMIGALYRAGLRLAEEDPVPGETERTVLAAFAGAGTPRALIKPSVPMGLQRIMKRIPGFKGSRIQAKGMEVKTLEPPNPGILEPCFRSK